MNRQKLILNKSKHYELILFFQNLKDKTNKLLIRAIFFSRLIKKIIKNIDDRAPC